MNSFNYSSQSILREYGMHLKTMNKGIKLNPKEISSREKHFFFLPPVSIWNRRNQIRWWFSRFPGPISSSSISTWWTNVWIIITNMTNSLPCFVRCSMYVYGIRSNVPSYIIYTLLKNITCNAIRYMKSQFWIHHECCQYSWTCPMMS